MSRVRRQGPWAGVASRLALQSRPRPSAGPTDTLPVLNVRDRSKRHARDFGADRDEAILHPDVAGLRIRLHSLQVIKIFPGHLRFRLFPSGKPGLGQVCLAHVIGRAGSTHCGWDPGGFQRIRENGGPTSRNGKGEHRVVDLALGVGCRTIPATLLPENIVEMGIDVLMHPGAEINKPLRPFDQGRMDERRQGEALRTPNRLRQYLTYKTLHRAKARPSTCRHQRAAKGRMPQPIPRPNRGKEADAL